MSTITTDRPLSAPVLPDLDPAVSAGLGDDILLEAVRTAKVEKVAGGTASALQSHSSRAWTLGGAVD